jgi:hypothetical protein
MRPICTVLAVAVAMSLAMAAPVLAAPASLPVTPVLLADMNDDNAIDTPEPKEETTKDQSEPADTDEDEGVASAKTASADLA